MVVPAARMARVFFMAIVVVWASMPGRASPQQGSTGALVQFSVTVLDKDHHPVSGLSQADFTVLEDGKPRPITTFTQVNATQPKADSMAVASAAQAAWTHDVQPDVATNDLPAGRLLVLVLDDALVPRWPKIAANAKRIGLDLIDHLGPADQMAVLLTSGQREQEFTTDHAPLQAAVSRMAPGLANWSLGYQDSGFGQDDVLYRRSLEAVDDAANALAASTARTKIIVYLTPGMPVENPVTSFDIGRGGFLSNQVSAQSAFHSQLANSWSRMLRDASRANVPIYTVDPCGKNGLDDFVSKRAGDIGAGPDERRQQLLEIAHRMSKYAMSYLDDTARKSGGRAISRTDDFAPDINAMLQENGVHYVLGYVATDPSDGRFHQLKVTVDRSGLETRATSGYYGAESPPSSQSRSAGATEVDASQARVLHSSAVSGPLPVTTLSLRAAVASFAGAPGRDPSVVAALELRLPAPVTTTTDTIDVQLIASAADTIARPMSAPPILQRLYASDPAPAGATRQTLRLPLSPDAPLHLVNDEWLSSLELSPGRYRLRFVVTDKTAGMAGSLLTDVDVPDFARGPVSLSDVVIATEPPPAQDGADAIDRIIPVVPSTQRTFAVTGATTVFVRVYDAGASTTATALTFRVISADDRTAWEQTAVLGAPTAARNTDVRVPLPLHTLKAGGCYLLRATATAVPTTVTREVRISVNRDHTRSGQTLRVRANPGDPCQ